MISPGVQVGDRVVIFSATRYEWRSDFAILAGVRSPYRSTRLVSGAGALGFTRLEAVVLFAETDSHATMVAELSGSVSVPRYRRSPWSGPNALFDRLTEAGASVDPAELTARLAALRSTDPATLIYTSGTTGRPGGPPVDPIQPGSRD
ncbi:AMP-binding protein [Mycobacterium tuberculosis]